MRWCWSRPPLTTDLIPKIVDDGRERQPNELDLIFASMEGTPMDATNLVNRVYLPAVKRAGLQRIRFHDLRHTFVTYCAAAGVPLAKVGDWVGHSDAKITEIYRHASADSEEFALGLLDQFDGSRGAPPTKETLRRRQRETDG